MALDGLGPQTVAQRAMKAEFLDADTERQLAYAWRDNGDEEALHRLVNAYMRLAVSVASKFRRYGAPMGDLVQEAGLGLMKAAYKFDPDKGVRFSTYAVWWVRASIQEYVMRNWSIVRTGSTSTQKLLFFNMRRVKARLEREAAARGETIGGQELREILAKELSVPLRDVEMMEGRLSGSDFSLNATVSSEDEGREWIEILEDENGIGAAQVEEENDNSLLRDWLDSALSELSEREQLIIRERQLPEKPRTLESLGNELGLSKERVRQIEAAAFAKMRKSLAAKSGEVHQFL